MYYDVFVDTLSFGRWLFGELKARRWRHEDLANRVGVKRPTVTRWVNDKKKPTEAGIIVALARALDVDRTWLMNKIGIDIPLPVEEPTVLMLPIADAFVAEPDDDGDGEYIAWVPDVRVADPNQFKAVRVRGTCLVPEINPGDVVVIDRYGRPINLDYVAVLIDGVRNVKRYERRGNQWVLATNDGREAIPAESVELVGVVVNLVRGRDDLRRRG